jgi:hypothetical protein
MSEGELFIRDEAGLRGIDGDTAVAVAMSEGGVDFPGLVGEFNTGTSFYQYQLHWGGPEYPQFGVPGESVAGMGNSFTSFTGWAPGDDNAARDACRYALNTAKRDGWGAWYGAAAIGITGFDGIDQSVAWDPNSQVWDYETLAGGGTVPPPTEPLPVFDPSFPAFAQNDDWSCAPTSTRWGLWAYGRQPSEQWLESSMINSGVVSTSQGLLDASGAGLADWITREYGEYGFVGQNDPSVTFDDVAGEAQRQIHPLMMGGRTWYHWTGVRGFDGSRLLLANPASGWMAVTQTMTREQFKYLGPFSMVRLTHPAAEGGTAPTPPGPNQPGYAPPGTVGSGLLELMAQDGTQPAGPSTFLPLGASPAMTEQATGLNGTIYSWHLPTGSSWRYRPS